MAEYKIESGIPIPSKTRVFKHMLFDWAKVKSGDSVFVKDLSTRSSLYVSLSNQAKRRGFKMITRIEKDGRRCWFMAKKEK